MNPYEIILHPYVSEKTMNLMDRDNILQFVVNVRANKKEIKEAVEQIFDVKIVDVKTRINKYGKMAIVKLSPDYEAEDIGMRVGIF
jgi:large subunit ribosomal protein L23